MTDILEIFFSHINILLHNLKIIYAYCNMYIHLTQYTSHCYDLILHSAQIKFFVLKSKIPTKKDNEIRYLFSL